MTEVKQYRTIYTASDGQTFGTGQEQCAKYQELLDTWKYAFHRTESVAIKDATKIMDNHCGAVLHVLKLDMPIAHISTNHLIRQDGTIRVNVPREFT